MFQYITDPSLIGHRVLWQEMSKGFPKDSRHKILYDGVPFIVNGEAIYDCQHGSDKHDAWRKIVKQRDENVSYSVYIIFKCLKILPYVLN